MERIIFLNKSPQTQLFSTRIKNKNNEETWSDKETSLNTNFIDTKNKLKTDIEEAAKMAKSEDILLLWLQENA